jgi:hypothetical protein
LSDFRLKTPVILIVYRRPETTEQVLQVLYQVNPTRLFVVGDGPRTDRPGEAAQVAHTRALIEQIEWECEVLTDYAEVNLGLRRRVVNGLDWVFEQVDRAIILEDDCVPDVSFFSFCEELLERYQNDERIMVISGDNFQHGRRRTRYSYYYSRYNHCWGWATWRRAWFHYDDRMSLWPQVREGGWLSDVLDGDRRAVNYWTAILDDVYANRIDSWAYPWTLACWVQGGLTILPNVNLVSNIGFDEAATHTVRRSRSAYLRAQSLENILQHPPFIIRDAQADKYTQDNHFGTSLKKSIKRAFARVLHSLGLMGA